LKSPLGKPPFRANNIDIFLHFQVFKYSINDVEEGELYRFFEFSPRDIATKVDDFEDEVVEKPHVKPRLFNGGGLLGYGNSQIAVDIILRGAFFWRSFVGHKLTQSKIHNGLHPTGTGLTRVAYEKKVGIYPIYSIIAF
jgi:hypothetical protein